MKVNFDPAKPFFVLGDLIQGIVTIIPSVPIEIGCVFVTVECHAQAHYVHHTPGSQQTSAVTTYPPLEYQYLKTTPFTVFDARPNGGVVLSATMMQPIAFQIPLSSELPSTLTHRMSTCGFKGVYPLSVTYTMKITTCGLAGNSIDETVVELDCRSVFVHPYPEKPLKVFHTVITPSCCTASNVFTFYCVTDRTVYGPGDRIRVSYWYHTHNPRTVPKLTAVTTKLESIALTVPPLRTNGAGPEFFSMESRSVLVNTACVIPKYLQVCHVFLDVPHNVLHSFLLSAPPHPITFRTELSVTLMIEHMSHFISLPVIFNSMNAAQMSQLSFPVMKKPLSQATAEAQELYISHPNPPALAAAPYFPPPVAMPVMVPMTRTSSAGAGGAAAPAPHVITTVVPVFPTAAPMPTAVPPAAPPTVTPVPVVPVVVEPLPQIVVTAVPE